MHNSASILRRDAGGAPRSDDDRCQVQGCRAHATQVASVAAGRTIAVCARCREELASLMPTAVLAATPD